MADMTRRERRALRRGRAVTVREARLAARLARLDYKTSGETGALRLPTRVGKWPHGTQPRPPGARRNGASPVRVIAAEEAEAASAGAHT